MYVYIYIYIYIYVYWGHQEGGLVTLWFVTFLNFPYTKICLLVWDSGLQLIYDN